jgi:phospholipid/cholesterol/gamma-HCH transport system substrate-binding protein
MEPKVNYILVGSFVAFLGAAVLVGILWLGKTDYRGSYDRYEAYMRESVAGLSVDSTVKYRGVDVGRVKTIVLNPNNPEEVLLTLDIMRGTPIKIDTIAVLETQGLTGLATVNLTGGSRDAPSLQAQDGQAYPVIKTGPSPSSAWMKPSPAYFQKKAWLNCWSISIRRPKGRRKSWMKTIAPC